jgi:hypothetical protein
MVTKQEQKPCPVCGKMVSQTGIAGHNKSKYHLDALEMQQQGQQPPKQDIQQTKPVPTITKDPVIKQEVKQTKIEFVKTTKPKQEKQEIKQDEGYNGLEWD